MADKPIPFSAPMVRAILREIARPGTGKTQTRRILKDAPAGDWFCDRVGPTGYRWVAAGGVPSMPCRLRYAVGDRLYVREHWRSWRWNDDLSLSAMPATWAKRPREYVSYLADADDGRMDGRFRQAMHMPRWASRITLLVTGVKVERLRNISREDAMAEGVVQTWGDFMGDPPEWAIASINRHGDASGSHIYDNRKSVENFHELWNYINGPSAWDANPWVAAYTFRPVAGNIDAIEGDG